MKRIITFLEAVKRCEVTGHYEYNDFNIICDEDRHLIELTSACDKAIEALCENQILCLPMVDRMVEDASDTIDKKMRQMRGERFSSDLLKNRVLYFLNVQKKHLDRFRVFLGALRGEAAGDNNAAPVPKEKESAAVTGNVSNVIGGIDGLAEHLGCGVNKAQEISNSGILKENGIQYSIGRKWVFNRGKLDAYIAANPEAFAHVSRRKS